MIAVVNGLVVGSYDFRRWMREAAIRGIMPVQASAAKRIDKGLILKALGEKVS